MFARRCLASLVLIVLGTSACSAITGEKEPLSALVEPTSTPYAPEPSLPTRGGAAELLNPPSPDSSTVDPPEDPQSPDTGGVDPPEDLPFTGTATDGDVDATCASFAAVVALDKEAGDVFESAFELAPNSGTEQEVLAIVQSRVVEFDPQAVELEGLYETIIEVAPSDLVPSVMVLKESSSTAWLRLRGAFVDAADLTALEANIDALFSDRAFADVVEKGASAALSLDTWTVPVCGFKITGVNAPGC